MIGEYELIVSRIKQLMKEAHITQKELSDSTRISESEITRIMRLKNVKISHQTIIALCSYFNVSADYLLGLVEKKADRKGGSDADNS